MPYLTDDILIEKSKKGDKQAYGVLIDRYSEYLFAVVFKIVSIETEAEDIVQETFIKAWHNLTTYNSVKGKFATWIYSIATRLTIDELRKRRYTTSIDEVDCYQEDDVHDQLTNREIGFQIQKATRCLSGLQKVVFVLRDLEDKEVDEVIALTGLSAKKIKDNLYVARQKIKEQLLKYVNY